ncbi:MAG: hypothetical protein PHO83_16725 [Geobacteraceae bacterium]|nr:hypothetical protein [Geobacteraceae bacterium]
MATDECVTRDQFRCPKTNRKETLTIKHTTVSKASRMVGVCHTDSFTRKNIEDCTGLDSCGVKTSHGMSATYKWELCPALELLNAR